MEIIKTILIWSGMVCGSAIFLIGVYGLIKKETYFPGKTSRGVEKLTGWKALRVSLYFVFAGLAWIWYSLAQLVGFLD